MERKITKICNKQTINFNKVYTQKIKLVDDFKLAEFNYKVLHQILACNDNLKKWKISDTNLCDVCKEQQEIPHLLFTCRLAQNIWTVVQTALKEKFTLSDIILGRDDTQINTTISIISYLIYKQWLMFKNNNKIRSWVKTTTFFKLELNDKIQVYKYTKLKVLCQLLYRIITTFRTH